jgi:hypothetical protein
MHTTACGRTAADAMLAAIAKKYAKCQVERSLPMRWVLSAFCGVALLAGCNGQGQTVDPFLGRTTIPPPGTGQVIMPGTAQPYYQGNPLPATPMPGSPAPLVSPPVGSSYRETDLGQRMVETPAEREYRVGRVATADLASEVRAVGVVVPLGDPRKVTANENQGLEVGLPASEWQNTPETGTSHDGIAASSYIRIPGDSLTNTPPDRFADPQAASLNFANNASAVPTLAKSLTVPASFQPPTGAIDISELPQASRSRTSNRRTTPAVFDSRSTSPRVALPSSNGTTRRQTSQYGYASDHAWLKGQLEYLRSKQEWKLRYIPIDGETDEYGGSVVIKDSSRLKDYEAGQFVTIKGSIDKASTGTSSFAPSFRVERINMTTE